MALSLSAPQTWWRFSADLVALLRRLGGASPQTWWRYICTEHCRTLQNIAEHSFKTFFRIQNRFLQKWSRYRTQGPTRYHRRLRPLARWSTCPPLGIFPHAREEPKVSQSVSLRRRSTRRDAWSKPNRANLRVSFARTCNPSSNAQLWRSSTGAIGFDPFLSYSTERQHLEMLQNSRLAASACPESTRWAFLAPYRR